MLKERIEKIVRRGFEVLDLPLPPYDERECRRLNPADGEHEPIMSRTPRRERIGAREIHPDEPVRAGTCKRRQFQREEVRVVAQIAEGIMYALIVKRIDEDAAHGLFIVEIVEHLVYEQLPLAVGIAAVHDLVRTLDQPLHDGELLCRTLIHNEPPLFGQDRQILRTPAFEPCIVLLRLRLPQHMTEKPCHHTRARFDTAVSLAVRLRQTGGQRAPDARFLRDIEPHANTFDNAQTRIAIQRTSTTMDAINTIVP